MKNTTSDEEIARLRTDLEIHEGALNESEAKVSELTEHIGHLQANCNSWSRGMTAWQTWAHCIIELAGHKEEGMTWGDEPARRIISSLLNELERLRSVSLAGQAHAEMSRADAAENRVAQLEMALRETLTWLRARPAIVGDGWQRTGRKTSAEVEALINAALGPT